jgi:hypothetical protein
MKYLTTILLLLTFTTNAQENTDNYIEKVKTLDSTLESLYAVISGEKGEARDWELMKFLFHQDAKLIPSGKNKEGTIGARFMTVKDYITSSGNWLV